MFKQSSENFKKSRKLILISSFTALVLIVATYAWFIGMRTVNVTSFDVEIASTDSLLLSLDGKKWSSTVSIDKDSYETYPGHTNSWGGAGLIPLSTVGELDETSSRMKLFEKTSLTATPGGYRLMSSQIDNTAKEIDGYVVFDLFVKNFSGTQYIKELNPLDEEAIYLTGDSVVKVATAGVDPGVEGTGIENSVRIAFAQVGRVHGNTKDENLITSIKCKTTDDVTNICRSAQIWEPNDTLHEENAIRWYNNSCLKRKNEDLTLKTSYEGACNPIENGKSYPTYAVNSTITSGDRVDIYDGPEYNGYTPSSLLTKFTYFKDSDMDFEGVQRHEFFTLAPNSITKIRVYIYIEGQDIDNYDFAVIGKKISIEFGFTKERFNESDIGYDGPELDPAYDQVPPVIELIGNDEVTINKGSIYVDQGATATDNLEGDITRKIIVNNPVDTSTPGTYIVTYNVRDWAGNRAEEVIRTVIVTE